MCVWFLLKPSKTKYTSLFPFLNYLILVINRDGGKRWSKYHLKMVSKWDQSAKTGEKSEIGFGKFVIIFVNNEILNL